MLARYVGTGRAKCTNCRAVIAKGMIGLDSYDGRSHPRKTCLKCIINLLKNDFLEMAIEMGR